MVSLDAIKQVIEGVKDKTNSFDFASDFFQTFTIPENKLSVDEHEQEKCQEAETIFLINDIIPLTDSIKNILTDSDNYYIFGCSSIYDSILFANMLDYKLFSEDKKKKLTHDFKLELISKVKDITNTNKFQSKSVKITEYLSLGDFNKEVLMFISHFLKRKLILLNIQSNIYEIFGDYGNPIVLIKENNNFMVLIHTLSAPFDSKLLEESNDWCEGFELQKITKYKMPDLIDIATKYNISLINDDGKKKIKTQLYDEIFKKIN